MKKAPLSLPFLLLGACAAVTPDGLSTPESEAAWHGRIQSWGSLHEALRDGQVQGRVALADVARAGMYAVGALEGLRGEVTVVDGEVWVSEVTGSGRPATRRAASSSDKATVLFAAEVPRWKEVVVAQEVDASELDSFVAAQAQAAGLDVSQPFPFLVEGELRQLHMHVVAGECPTRARMLGEEASSPPFELHSEALDGRLVGLFAGDSAGVLSHMGSKSHIHAVLERDGDLTGHADSVGLARGSILKLPQR